MAFIDPDAVVDFANRDTNRIEGRIGEVLALRSPYMDILSGGTISNISDVVRSIVQERAVMAASLSSPQFTPDVQMCGDRGGLDEVGSTEYSYQLESLRGRGPRVCVKATRTAFEGSYLQAQIALENGILQITNADIRHTLYKRSGVKCVLNSTKTLDNMLEGDIQEIDTKFAQFLPDAAPNFKTLRRLGGFMKEEMLVDPWESDQGTMFKVIGSDDTIERFRDELDIREDLRALTTGKYTIGKKSIDSFAFSGPYRQYAFAVDPQPLRAVGFGGDGWPILVEPEISVATTKGVAARRNPAWITAPYEVMFLICQNSFQRLVPESYTGEGTFKFAPQLHGGQLEWAYFRDNQDNLFGDYGQHIYQISRAYRPFRPHAVLPILYTRCEPDLELEPCTPISGSSSSTGGL